jgi:spermidine synthase
MLKPGGYRVFNSWMDLPKVGEVSREEAAVVASGIVSMGLEILAGRVIAPEFGSTIYTWGSIIGVSMLALSLGYHYGGRNSSGIKGMEDLEGFLIYTSGYILFVMFFGKSILTASSALPLNPMYAPIVPVVLLFGPPTYFLGYISPYAAQLSSKDTKGEASGHFYAIGTAGSILGAFGTTFLLVPTFSVDQIYLFFAVLAALPLFNGWRNPRSYYPLGALLLGLLLVQGPSLSGDTVYQTDTAYQSLEVTRSDGVTKLFLDGQQQSAKYLNSTGTPWDYPEYFYLPFLMREDVDNALFIGGGGFVSPQQFAEQGVKVDAVELDPGVVEAAKRYFNLSESENLSVHTMDGREFLEQTNRTYDVVVLDAFRKDKVPFHLTTREFFQLVHRKTDEEGVVVSNLISTSSGPGSKFSRSYYRTMAQEFNSMYYFPTRETSFVQNVEIIASKEPRLSKQELRARNQDFDAKDLSEEIENLEEMEPGDAQILTDDYAPVDQLLNPLVGRRYVVS